MYLKICNSSENVSTRMLWKICFFLFLLIYIYIIYTLYLTFTNNTGTAWLSPPWPMHKDKYQLSKCSDHQRQVLKGPLTKLTIVHISNIKKKPKPLIILYVWIQWCNKTTQILLTPPPLVGRGYRLSHFWLAKEVNIEVKKKLQQQCL